MNSPNISESMRERIVRSDPRHPSNKLPGAMQLLFASLWVVSMCLLSAGGALRQDQPGIALALALCSLMIILSNLAWRGLVLRHLRSIRS